MTGTLDALARDLAAAWKSRTTIAIPADGPKTRAEAHRIQDRMCELIGDAVTGWKIGAALPAIREMEGHNGTMPGRMFASRTFENTASIKAEDFPDIRAECELAIRATETIPARAKPYRLDELRGTLILYPAIELCATRYAPGRQVRALNTYDAIADNAYGSGFMFGKPFVNWAALDFKTLDANASVNNGPRLTSYSGDFRGDPFDVALETINEITGRGLDVEAGHFFSTGSLTRPTPMKKGDTLDVTFEKLGSLKLSLV
jgi:2-oxo-hept-3-ene-1,7-dioate hydratase